MAAARAAKKPLVVHAVAAHAPDHLAPKAPARLPNTSANQKGDPSMPAPATPASPTLSRRALVAGAAAAGTFVSMGLYAADMPRAAQAAPAAATDYAVLDPATAPAADESIDADVVVVGCGVAGMIAATAAAKQGAKTVAIDRAPNIAATNACNTAGIWAVESSEELKWDTHITQQWAFDHIWEGTHYQSNASALRNVLRASGPGMDLIIEAGTPLMFPFENDADPNEIGVLNWGGHVYMVSGPERAEYLQGMIDAAGAECLWGCEVTNLLVSDGAVVGVRLVDGEGATVDVNAPQTIVCTGGFIQDLDMVAKYYGGARMYGAGSPFNDGAGIKLAQAAGAQMGKNFSTSINELGAANARSTDFIVGNVAETPLFCLPLFGGLFVNGQGRRFMDESKMATSTMYCAEPMLRESTYYVVLDQALVDLYSSNEITGFMSESAIANMAPVVQMSFAGVTLTQMPAKIDQGIEEGWVWKADTLDELAKACGLAQLPAEVARYNEACAAAEDNDFFKPAEFLAAVETGPFYAVQLDVAAWLTLGGIKCDDECRALDAQNSPIPGLFVAGADADLWAVPYFQGGSAQGFCVASGYLAGLTAAGGNIREA